MRWSLETGAIPDGGLSRNHRTPWWWLSVMVVREKCDEKRGQF